MIRLICIACVHQKATKIEGYSFGIMGFCLLLIVSFGWGCKDIKRKTANAHPSDINIRWDKSTLTNVSVLTPNAHYNGYARLIKLDDGSLICVYESDGNIVAVTSDDGVSWSDKVTIAAKESGINMATPDILELNDHSLLVSYNPRPVQPYEQSKRFAIRTKISNEGGKTWGSERVLYKAGYRPENGCWEPSVVQLPSGEIQLFFSNEGVFPNSDEQNISLMRSQDGGLTWTDDPEIASFRAESRDGMPVPLVLRKSSEIVFSLEDNSGRNFKPYTIRNTINDNWAKPVRGNSKNRSYALANKINAADYAGAPYLIQLPSGKTVLSYQGTEGRKPDNVNGAEMKVVIGDNKARNFKHKSVPFNIPVNSNGLWNSLAVLNDTTIAALTSTNAFSDEGRTEVWMIKGYVHDAVTN